FWLLLEETGRKAKQNIDWLPEIIRKLTAALEQDPRFHAITWRPQEEGPPEPEEIGSPSIRATASSIKAEPLLESHRPLRTPNSEGLGCFFIFVLLCSAGLACF